MRKGFPPPLPLLYLSPALPQPLTLPQLLVLTPSDWQMLLVRGRAHGEQIGNWLQAKPLLLQDTKKSPKPLAWGLPIALSGQQEALSGKGI